MKITMVCSICKKKFTGKNEYEAENKYSIHVDKTHSKELDKMSMNDLLEKIQGKQ